MGSSGEESWAWARKLPRKEEVEEQERAFKVFRPTGILPRDANLGVFGSLTRRGLAQTRALGQALRQDYGEHLGDEAVEKVFTYTSNFHRTQRTAQSVLQGLLDVNPTDAAIKEHGKIRVSVTADPSTDHINVYPHMPELGQRMKEIVVDKDHPSRLHAAEKEMAPLKGILSQVGMYEFSLRVFSPSL